MPCLSSHQKAERASPLSGIAPYRDLVASICAGLAASDALAERISDLTAQLQRQVDRAAAILDARAAHGFVRRCHGDLHLANIVLHHGQPTLYDAIEFDEALATIDTLYDLAFLLMDLDVLGQRLAANLVLNRYLCCSGEDLDLNGLAALPLFLALRAAIRALVTSDRAAQQDGPGRNRDLERARRYLSAALDYAMPAAPKLVVVGGLSGTGKTTLAAALAPWLGAAPGAVHLRSDLERKMLAGVGELERLPPTAYTPEARQGVYKSLHQKAASALTAKHSVIIDAVYDEERQRREIEALAEFLADTLVRTLVAGRCGDADGESSGPSYRRLRRHACCRATSADRRNWPSIGAMGAARCWQQRARDTGGRDVGHRCQKQPR